jgi:hypothetical protein
MDSSGVGQSPVVGACKHSNELLGPVDGGEFLDQLSACQLLMTTVLNEVNIQPLQLTWVSKKRSYAHAAVKNEM